MSLSVPIAVSLRSSCFPHALVALAVALALLGRGSGAIAAPSSTSPEQAYDLGEFPHPRSLAMAGAQQVYGGSTNAVYTNPANLPLYRVYHVEGLAALGPEARRQTYGGAVVDSSTGRLAGGFGGAWSQFDPDGIRRTTTDLRLALAFPVSDRLSLGAAGRYLNVSQRVASGPFGASLVSDGANDESLFKDFTFDVGLALQITEHVRAGLSGRNLTAPGTALAPVVLAGGVGFSASNVTIEANELFDFTTFGSARSRTMAGGEVLIADRFPLRAGYRYDEGVKTHAVGLGVGYVDKQFSVDFGGRREVTGDHPSTTLGLALRIFISGLSGSQEPSDGF